MPDIQQLEAHVADLIAAGEVVERPASVVKELVENAIDAGASAVAVEIRRGGMGMIRVMDNGCGIAPEQLPTAFLRHATSKLRGPQDLGSIGTLGFRGEALAAISAVSRVEILSCQAGSPLGASLRLEGGLPGEVEEAGAPVGTSITVENLFYNTPARLKFMKKDSAETAAVAGLMQHLALSRPDISFQFAKDGQDALHTPGDGRLDSAIYAALGRDFAKSLLPVEGGSGEVRVRGFITQPLLCRGSRGMQVFFVNGRFIKSQLLTAALEEGYRNQMMKGKFPGCVLMVTLPTTQVDVNVHPAKTQVKFAREKEVFDAVYHTVLDSLEAANPTGSPRPRQDFYQTMSSKTYRELREKHRPSHSPSPDKSQGAIVMLRDSGSQTPKAPALGKAPVSVAAAKPSGAPTPKQKAIPPRPPMPQTPIPQPPKPTPLKPAIPKPEPPAPQTQLPQVPAETPVQQSIQPPSDVPWRMAGEVLHTYIVCEAGDDVYLIDKHAAHERVNFDRLMAGEEPPMVQTLLVPATAELSREDMALLLEELPLLEHLGFSCEDFGNGVLLVREIPADLDADSISSTLEELAQSLRAGRNPQERREKLFQKMACQSAIKGGWVSDPAELQALVDKVQRGEVKYCPHGRPVAVKLSRYEIEKLFKRA